MTRILRKQFGRTALAIALVIGLAAFVGCEAVDPPDTVSFVGHGWGHGRGLSQFGAYGYAVDHGWTGSQILDRYYGGTRTGLAADARQRVFLTAQTGKDLVVANTLGTMTTSADGYKATFKALRIQRVDNTHFKLFTGQTCAGPWSAWTNQRTVASIRVKPPVRSDDPRTMLQVCTATGSKYYRGDLLAVHVNSTVQTVNDIEIEDQIRAVIPREIPASWADAGNGRGANALRAQAIAARSYALAGDTRFSPWATTCDSTLCQVYGGYGTRARNATTIAKNEDPRSDLAVLATRLQVRTFPNGTIARTEFSSSSGGFTAGGTFPVGRDDGDDTKLNPNHTWKATVGRTAIEAAFDKHEGKDLGTYVGLEVTKRNGYGDLGGRVLTVTTTFEKGEVTLTGNQFRIVMGFKSDWFGIAPTPTGAG